MLAQVIYIQTLLWRTFLIGVGVSETSLVLVLRGVSFSVVLFSACTFFSNHFGAVFLCVCLQKMLPVRMLPNTPLYGQSEHKQVIISPPGVTCTHYKQPKTSAGRASGGHRPAGSIKHI